MIDGGCGRVWKSTKGPSGLIIFSRLENIELQAEINISCKCGYSLFEFPAIIRRDSIALATHQNEEIDLKNIGGGIHANPKVIKTTVNGT